MRLVLSEPEKASEEPSLLHKRDFPTFHDLLLNISQKSQPYKIFSQLIQENVFTNEELNALEELIKLRK